MVQKTNLKNMTVCIVGLGYVGMPLAEAFSKHVHIIGFDINEKKVQKLNLELEQRVRERTAELEASNRELESFAYSVSHDLRSPLTAILGYIELIERVGEVNQQQREFIRRVQFSVEQISNLITDLSLKAKDVPLLAGELVNADQNGACAGMNTIIDELPRTIPTARVISSCGKSLVLKNKHGGLRDSERMRRVSSLTRGGCWRTGTRRASPMMLKSGGIFLRLASCGATVSSRTPRSAQFILRQAANSSQCLIDTGSLLIRKCGENLLPGVGIQQQNQSCGFLFGGKSHCCVL
jgi:hypothetical protein